MKISQIKPNPNNPRLIKDDKFKKLVKSIEEFPEMMEKRPIVCVTDVDAGATNRKLGSDMGRAVTGGGLHGKDLSKADVSVNIYAHLKAQEQNKDVNICCAIGDDKVDGLEYVEIVELARQYITKIGGFEKLAEWGLV